MSKLFKTALSILTLCAFSSVASANVITVDLDFDSGAEFLGTITFSETHGGMIDTEGYLNGGTYGFVNEYFHWTWWQGTSSANPQDSNGDGLYNDWLMNGTDGGSYSMYIGLSWTGSGVTGGGLMFDSSLPDPYFNGNRAYNDLIVSINNVGVPAPAAIVIFGLGLVLLGFSRAARA